MSARYHPGEIEVQERARGAGVRPMAERIGNSIHPTIPPAARGFLKEQSMVVAGSIGMDGHVWASLLVGDPGFLRALDERTVRIDATPTPGDPLAEALQATGAGIGVLAIDRAIRRRLRLNGKAESHPDGIYLRIRQVYARQGLYLCAVARESGKVLCVSRERLKEVVAEEPNISDTILKAFPSRRAIGMREGLGLGIIGSRHLAAATRLREFAARNRLPHAWIELEEDPRAEGLLERFTV